MKKHLLLLATLFVGLIACEQKEIIPEYTISVEPESLVFKMEGEEKTVTVESNGEWHLYSNTYDDSWCEPSADRGKGNEEIIFTVQPNPDTKERSIKYIFSCQDKKAELLITQEPKVYSISVGMEQMFFDADGEEKEITVTSSDDWTLKVKDRWCHPSVTSGKNGDKMTFWVERYYETEERSTIATFTCGDKTLELPIIQSAKEYSVSANETELTFDADGGEQEITISSSDDWTIKRSYPSWVSTSVSRGEDGDKVNVMVAESTLTEQRDAVITFECGNKTFDLNIVQTAREYSISIDKTDLELDVTGGDCEITVTSSYRWRLTDYPEWCKSSITSGENGDKVTLSFDYNDTPDERTETIVFTCGDKTAELAVHQGIDESPIIEFKDPYFLYALLGKNDGLDKNNDEQISEAEAKSIKELIIDSKKNSSSNYNIRNIDNLTLFTSLEKITIKNVSIEEIDISNHKTLKKVDIQYSNAEILDLSGCISLTEFISNEKMNHHNEFTTLNFTGCVALKQINLYYVISWTGGGATYKTNVNNLYLSGCTALTSLSCYESQLTSLDVSGCTALTDLVCNNYQLTSLDVSNCTALTDLACSSNQLTSLDVSSCTALTYLACYGNQLTTLDLSKNVALAELWCDENQLTTLDVSKNMALTTLCCRKNQLTTLDLSKNVALAELRCDENQLTTLDVSKNMALTTLCCRKNQLTTLDLSKNVALAYLYCSGNELTTLDVSGCTALTYLACSSNQLISLDLSKNTTLGNLYCSENQLTELDLRNQKKLTSLYCPDNPLITIYLPKYHILDGSSMEELEKMSGLEIIYIE